MYGLVKVEWYLSGCSESDFTRNSCISASVISLSVKTLEPIPGIQSGSDHRLSIHGINATPRSYGVLMAPFSTNNSTDMSLSMRPGSVPSGAIL